MQVPGSSAGKRRGDAGSGARKPWQTEGPNIAAAAARLICWPAVANESHATGPLTTTGMCIP
jgi:hypothetical protein